jgi:cytidylate kinase
LPTGFLFEKSFPPGYILVTGFRKVEGCTMKNIFSIDSATVYQEANWKRRKDTVEMTGDRATPFITISREYGCLGFYVGKAVTKILNDEFKQDPPWSVYERKILKHLTEDMHISLELAETLTDRAKSSMADYFRMTFSNYPPEAVVYKKLVEIIRLIAANGHAVIVGRVGNVITRDLPNGFHVRIIASPEKKIQNIKAHFNVSRKEAKQILARKGETREHFLLKHLKVDMTDSSLYDLVINTTEYTVEQTARLVITGMQSYGLGPYAVQTSSVK